MTNPNDQAFAQGTLNYTGLTKIEFMSTVFMALRNCSPKQAVHDADRLIEALNINEEEKERKDQR